MQERYIRLVGIGILVTMLSACSLHEKPLRVGVIGDYGTNTEEEYRVAEILLKQSPDFIVTTGDNSYGGPGSYPTHVGAAYGSYLRSDSTDDRRKSSRFYPTIGNHDYDVGLDQFAHYFGIPENRRYYTVTRGRATFYFINSDPREPDGITPGSIQEQWLKEELRSSRAPWKIVVMHHPAHSSPSEHLESPALRWAFTGVQLILQGHNHLYERLHADGKTWITIGNSGKNLYTLAGPRLPESAVLDTTQFGFGLLEINRRSLTLTSMSAEGAVIDLWNAEPTR